MSGKLHAPTSIYIRLGLDTTGRDRNSSQPTV